MPGVRAAQRPVVAGVHDRNDRPRAPAGRRVFFNPTFLVPPEFPSFGPGQTNTVSDLVPPLGDDSDLLVDYRARVRWLPLLIPPPRRK